MGAWAEGTTLSKWARGQPRRSMLLRACVQAVALVVAFTGYRSAVEPRGSGDARKFSKKMVPPFTRAMRRRSVSKFGFR